MRNSRIILAKNIQIDRDYKNVLNYSNNQLLETLRHSSHLVGEANNYSFIQKSLNEIIVGFSYEQCLTANYIAFQNPNYSQKWFFAWIDEVTFYSQEATQIKFVVDDWSTWFEKLNFKPCYVLREHVNNDTIGANTIDEGLSVGEVMANESPIYDPDLDSDYYIAVATNWNPKDETGYNGISAYTKAIFGQMIVLFPLNESGVYNLEHFIFITGGQAHTSDIHDMFIIPKMLVPDSSWIEETFYKTVAGIEVGCTMRTLRYDSEYAYKAFTKGYNINKLHNFQGVNIKNNKCFCYPYNYLLVSNNVGSSNVYKYEDFGTEDTCDFQLQMSLTIGVSGRVVPLAYKNQEENVDESIELGKLPTCGWSSDSYTNWLTQNAVNFSQRVLGTEVTNAIAKVGEITSSLLPAQIGNAIGSFSKQQLLPEVTGGQATADVNFSSKNVSFHFIRMHSKPEYIKQIDDYFTKFGYKINRITIPNIAGRSQFNYIEIGTGENFAYGEVPASSLRNINQIARNGVTIWHNHNNIGNYYLDNNII